MQMCTFKPGLKERSEGSDVAGRDLLMIRESRVDINMDTHKQPKLLQQKEAELFPFHQFGLVTKWKSRAAGTAGWSAGGVTPDLTGHRAAPAGLQSCPTALSGPWSPLQSPCWTVPVKVVEVESVWSCTGADLEQKQPPAAPEDEQRRTTVHLLRCI